MTKTRSQIGKMSKRKGKNYERTISKLLNDWWLGVGEDLQFHPTPASGGLRWRKKEGIFGDIVTPKDFPFVIECKNVVGWSFDQLLGNNKKDMVGPIPGWWLEAEENAHRLVNETGIDKIPVLIFTKNQSPDYIMFEQSDLYEPFDIYLSGLPEGSRLLTDDWIIMKFNDFMVPSSAKALKEL